MQKSFMAFTAVIALLLSITPVFAADKVASPSADFFENAWQEATASQAYGFSCTTSSTGVKLAKGATLTSDQKKMVDMTVKALKKYKSTTLGTLLGAKKQIYTSTVSLNTLGILDTFGAGKLTLDEAVQKMKTAKKGKFELALDGNFIYYKGNKGWKVFENADLAALLYAAASGSPITSTLEKSSFAFKNYTNPGKSQPAVYQGTLTAKETTTLMTPFIGEETAKKQDPSPTKLVITGDGHFQRYDMVGKVVLGGLSFTVKQHCNISMKNATIKLPSGATTIDAAGGRKELSESAQAL